MELSLIFEAITVVAVTFGILLGLLQLRHYHLSRTREADIYLLNSFQTGEFLEGIWIIQGLPNGLTKTELEKKLGEGIRSVYLVISVWESIGILVFNHEISIDMVDDAYGGRIITSWQRLEKYVTQSRDVLQRERTFEWFQWLAERMSDREKTKPPIPAHVAHRDWA